MTDEERDAFWRVMDPGLPRQGPGSRESTSRALWMIPTLPARPRVLDLGCGSGPQTLVLAQLLPDASITAIDSHGPFVDELRRRAEASGVADRVTGVQGDFITDLPQGPWDLIWSEGAAYFSGL